MTMSREINAGKPGDHTMKQAMTLQGENNEFIHLLAIHYPKCFFEEPRLRRPLSKNVIADIKKDTGFDVTPERITPAVEWYMSHIGYDHALAVAGSKRIDLNGREVGTVTEQEALAAQQRIDEFHPTD
jgi:sRNA-binding protein